jgi:hypothetical protein
MDGGDASFTRQDAEASLNSVTVSFTLDGAPLSTTRNPQFRRRFAPFGLVWQDPGP